MKRAARAWPLALLALLAGCGMYGELYLEEEPPRVPEITEAEPIATEAPADPAGSDAPARDDEEGEDDTAGGS